MTTRSTLIIYEEQIFNVGEDTFVDSTAENNNAVVFEDNCETGYFYALDRNNNGLKVLDGLHIYNVENVTDKDKPSVVKILWTQDLTKAFLSINDYYHAGYCRNGFPETNNPWTKVRERKLTASLIDELRNS